MQQINATRTVYTVGDFLEWQRSGTLQLKPIFQRRDVWNPKAKSLLIDTVVRGLPIPIVFLRKTQDLETLKVGTEVVDGQQRLRTLFGFIDPDSLNDFDPSRDLFTVSRSHNKEIAGKKFANLDDYIKLAILNYEISTHVFPSNTGDDVVLRIFARLNSTGSDLNKQELRNARYFGDLKSSAYDLAFEHLDKWRRWGLFNENDLARMVEVESVSDYMMAMIRGQVTGKSQPSLDSLYEEFEDVFPGREEIEKRFRAVMDGIDTYAGDMLSQTRLSRSALFYSLFTACYDHMYNFTAPTQSMKKNDLPKGLGRSLQDLNTKLVAGDLTDEVADAMDRATSDKGRRDTRHTFFKAELGL